MATIGTSYGGDLNRPGYTDEGGITGIREQLNDIISDISPTETPFFTKCGKESAKNTYVEWQTAELRDAQVDGVVEGEDTGSAFSPTVRVGNYTRIGKQGFKVSGTATALSLAGRDKEYARQALVAGKELKRDLEMALLGTQGRDAGSTTKARQLCGVGGWITTNTIGDATFPTDPDGTGGFAAGSGAAFVQADFDTILQAIWSEGGEPDRVYLSADLMAACVAGLEGNNNARTDNALTTVNNNVVRYQTPWGEISFVPDRFMPAGSIYIVDSSKFKVATLRGWKQEKLAKTGDSMHGQIVGEHTLVCLNEKASGHMATYTA
jgi:hypothetical protein